MNGWRLDDVSLSYFKPKSRSVNLRIVKTYDVQRKANKSYIFDAELKSQSSGLDRSQ